MFDGRFRYAVDRTTTPVGRALVAAGVTADLLTLVGLVMSAAAAVVIGLGDFAIGVVLVVATGLPDLFDGPVAKAAGTASVRGAFLDSVADRVADGFLYGGLAWYLAAHHHGTLAVVPFAIMVVSGLISYERAKAELLGLVAKGGLMERAERFIALGLCLIAAAVDRSALVPGLVVFLVLVTATAVGRFLKVWRIAPTAAVAPAAVPAVAPTGDAAALRWKRGRVDSRWRAWRAERAQATRLSVVGAASDGAGVRRRVSSVGLRRSGEPSGRWRARRADVPASRVGHLWRQRRSGRARQRGGRRSGASTR